MFGSYSGSTCPSPQATAVVLREARKRLAPEAHACRLLCTERHRVCRMMLDHHRNSRAIAAEWKMGGA